MGVATYGKEQTTTTEAEEELNLDPVRDDDVVVTECITNNGESGVCVMYYLCELDTKQIIEDGNTSIYARAIEQCPLRLEICCLRNHVVNSTSPPKPSKLSIEGDVNSNSADNPSAHGPSSEDAAESAETTATVRKCGFSKPSDICILRDSSSPSDRMYAYPGEFPWMVALLKRSGDDEWNTFNYIGGGSLIHPLVVMTVAHKMKKLKANQIKIRAGEYDTNSEDELNEHQERNVAKILVHPHYFRPSLYNDIALLVLEAPVVLENAPHIGIGCLAPQLPPPGTQCFSMGWGAEYFANETDFASVLKKVKLPLVEKNKCETDLRKAYLGNVFRLHQSLVCAGGEEGIDTWTGDQGSPLVCSLDAKRLASKQMVHLMLSDPVARGPWNCNALGVASLGNCIKQVKRYAGILANLSFIAEHVGSRFAIYGMVAYRMDGYGTKDVPGVYVNVPNLYEWVGQQLLSEGMDSKSYTVV